jgi:hypothetical protein
MLRGGAGVVWECRVVRFKRQAGRQWVMRGLGRLELFRAAQS